MSGIDGAMYLEEKPKKIIELYAECIKLFQSIDISDCPFNNNIDNRLTELDYLLDNNLADVNVTNLYQYRGMLHCVLSNKVTTELR